MIAELVNQYDTLKRCGEVIPDPGFKALQVSLEIIVGADGMCRVIWLEKPDTSKKTSKTTIPILDYDCPVTEVSEVRSSGGDTPHGIVDNSTWVFGELCARKKKKDGKNPGIALRETYLRKLDEFCKSNDRIVEVLRIRDILKEDARRQEVWNAVLKVLQEKVHHEDKSKWLTAAGKKNIRWVIEAMGTQGKPVHSLPHVKDAWMDFQKKQREWWLVSCLDGKEHPARLLHPKVGRASLIAFNDPVFYSGQLHEDFRKKLDSKGKETGNSALSAQIGFDEAAKYARALAWLIEHSSVSFGDTANCVWIDQTGEDQTMLDRGAHELTKRQERPTTFSMGKARGKKAEVLADTTDLIQSLRQFRNGRPADYRNKRFYLLSLLLRQKGRHAILGGYTGTMGELEANTEHFVQRTSLLLPKGFPFAEDKLREFCPTLMDILDASSNESEKQKLSAWNREVIGVIVHGQHLPVDLCRKVVLNAMRHKHLETSRESKIKIGYLKLLVVAAACSRHRLNTTSGKEKYGMELNTQIATPGYLAGRFFAVCEDIQKKAREWKATLSDKLFGAAISRPRETLARLYQNCRCYDISRSEDEWFKEILGKVRLSESATEGTTCMPEDGVDSFEFILGYWHQRARIHEVREANKKVRKEGEESHGTEEPNKE